MALVKFLNAQISLAANFSSDVWDVTNLRNGSMQVSWTGADATDGVLTVKISDDGVNFFDVDVVPLSLTVGAPTGGDMWVFSELPFRYIRLDFVANSNTTGTVAVRSYGTDNNLGWK